MLRAPCASISTEVGAHFFADILYVWVSLDGRWTFTVSYKSAKETDATQAQHAHNIQKVMLFMSGIQPRQPKLLSETP